MQLLLTLSPPWCTVCALSALCVCTQCTQKCTVCVCTLGHSKCTHSVNTLPMRTRSSLSAFIELSVCSVHSVHSHCSQCLTVPPAFTRTTCYWSITFQIFASNQFHHACRQVKGAAWWRGVTIIICTPLFYREMIAQLLVKRVSCHS